MVPKPGQLPFGIAASRLLDLSDAFRFGNFSGNQLLDFMQTESLRCSRADFSECFNLFYNAVRKHLFDAAIDSVVQIVAFTKDENT